jgi:hypothetical protein
MKKLVTVSAIVFFMIFTAGLATARAASLFPFSGHGDLESSTDLGALNSPLKGTITVDEVAGSNGFLYNGVLTWTTAPSGGKTITAHYSAVSDTGNYKGVFTFTGLTTASTPATVQGSFVFEEAQDPNDNYEVQEAVLIQFFLPSAGISFTGPIFRNTATGAEE